MNLPILALGAISPFLINSVSVRGTRLPVNLDTQVGRHYDIALIRRDVHRLWDTGRFADVQVETSRGVTGTSVTFRVIESPRLLLRRIHFEPAIHDIAFEVPEGTPISALRAHQLAFQARLRLIAGGYPEARVDSELVPVASGRVDLRLTVRRGQRRRVKQVDFGGDLLFSLRDLRGALRELRPRRFIFWRQYPAASAGALASDAARMRSFYLARGYFDAQVRVQSSADKGTFTRVHMVIDPGRKYPVDPAAIKNVCSSLLEARRNSERQGILDFSAIVYPDLSFDAARGKSYRIGRIEFHGNRHFSDAAIRGNLLVAEGGLLDQSLLRKSIERINRTRMFEPVAAADVSIRSDEKSAVADIDIRLKERKRGTWMLSGPVGPASFAGPLQASISSRLASWRTGVFDLSTYSLSVSMVAFAGPIIRALSIAPKQPFIPILVLQRPFSPASGWLSGFSVIPQLGWRASAFGYAVTQIQQRTLPALSSAAEPDLVATLRHDETDVPLFCALPSPRFAWVRRSATLSIDFLGVLAGL